MHRVRLVACCLALCCAASMLAAFAEDNPSGRTGPAVDSPVVMISLADRDAPSTDEWRALHEDEERAFSFGSLGDLKSEKVSFMNSEYFTPNSAEGTLASYGKMTSKGGFDRYGHITGVEFDIPANSWKERYAVNAAALVKLAGKARFAEFAGVEVDAAVKDKRQIEVTFLGTIVPKDLAIRRLNSDIEALDYLGSLYEKHSQFVKQGGLKLFKGSPPPQPKVVLANVVMLDRRFSKELDGAGGAAAKSIIHGIGGQLQLARAKSEAVTLLTPVVRCYRTYSIEFKTSADGDLVRTERADSNGRKVRVPQVFDLTSDL